MSTYILMLVNAFVAVVNIILPMLPWGVEKELVEIRVYDGGYGGTEFGYQDKSLNIFSFAGNGSQNPLFGIITQSLLGFYIISSALLLIGAVLAVFKLKISGGITLAGNIAYQNWTFILLILVVSIHVLLTRSSGEQGYITPVPYIMYGSSLVGIVTSALVLAKHRKKQTSE